MKKLDELYPLFSPGDLGLYAGGSVLLTLGIVFAFIGVAPLPGIIIMLLAFVGLGAILFITAIVSLISRYKLRKQVVGIRGSILFINQSHWNNSYVKEFIDENISNNFHYDLVFDLNRKIKSSLGENLCKAANEPNRLSRCKDFEPVTFCFLKDEGKVVFKWGNLRKKVAGLQKGNRTEVDLSVGMPHKALTVVGLIEHELWHVLLSKTFPNSSTNWQHILMTFPIE